MTDIRPATAETLHGKVVLVAGATRGAGRGIAVQLGAAGATVYATGRTTRAERSEMNRPETIEETAELVTQAGGEGIGVQVDHLVPEQVRALVERIDREQGRLDVLVNDVWGGDPLAEWNKPVWEHSLDKGLRLLRLAVDTHIITSHFALPLLIRQPGGLLVEVTDGTAEFNVDYRGTVGLYYDLAKISAIRLAIVEADELAPHGSTALSLTPGWLRSEMMLEGFEVTEHNWRDAVVNHTSVYRSHPITWAARSPRLPQIQRWHAGTESRYPAAPSRRSMASPILTAASPTPGATSLKSNVSASQRTRRDTDDEIARIGEELCMSMVTCDIAASVDGYVAGPNQSLENPLGEGAEERLHRWMFDGAEDNAEEIAAVTSAGAYIMGRNMFSPGRGAWDEEWQGWWGPEPPYHAPVFVLTHHPREVLVMEGGTTFTFVTDGAESALAQARAAAGDRNVSIAGGAATINQYLAAGHIDELRLHVAPVILGSGERLFAGVRDVDLEHVRTRGNELVTHTTYRMTR